MHSFIWAAKFFFVQRISQRFLKKSKAFKQPYGLEFMLRNILAEYDNKVCKQKKKKKRKSSKTLVNFVTWMRDFELPHPMKAFQFFRGGITVF